MHETDYKLAVKKIRQKECTDIDRNTGDGIGMRSYAFRTEDSE